MCIWVAVHYISWSPSHSCTQIFQFLHERSSCFSSFVFPSLLPPVFCHCCLVSSFIFILEWHLLALFNLPSWPYSPLFLPLIHWGLCGLDIFSHLSYRWWPSILPQNLISITPYSECVVSLFNLPLPLIHRQENLSGLPGSWSQQQMVRLLYADILNLSTCMFCIIYEAIMKNSFSRFQANAVFPCKDDDWTWP